MNNSRIKRTHKKQYRGGMKGIKETIPTQSVYLDRDKEFTDVLSLGPKRGRAQKNIFKTPEEYRKSLKWTSTAPLEYVKTTIYDNDGYDINGYDIDGLDIDGYDAIGMDNDGYDIDGNYIAEEESGEESDEEEEYIIPKGTLNSEYCKDKYKNNLPVDLNKVKYTTGSVNHDTASIFLGKHQYKNDLGQYVFGPLIQLSDIPALLEYEGKKLNVIEYINKGSFGTVIRYSERTPLPDEYIERLSEFGIYYYNTSTGDYSTIRPRISGIPYYELAVKTYSNQTDSEIELINNLNNDGKQESSSGMCNTVNSKILENNSGENFAIMDLMDGTLSDLIKDGLTITQAIEITLEITKSFKCLLDKGFSYTDLKSANVLYKCYKDSQGDGHIKVVLGDIGSICKKSIEQEPIWTSDFYITESPVSSGVATYPPPESIDDAANTPCNENTMSWDIGVILLELLGYNTLNEFYWGSELIEKCVTTYSDADACFLNYIRNMTLPRINELYNLDDIILYGIPNIGNITLYDLLKNIMDKKEIRINLEQIINGLNNQPY